MVSLTADMSPLHPDRNLALELVRATEAAAIRSVPFIGRGAKEAADGAAVDAMRAFLGTVNFDGVIVIGEGEKDNAPMLFNGEHVGTGRGPQCDVAVDPIDGTSLTAAGRNNALSVIAVSDRGAMLDASSVFYMDKLVTGPAGVGVVDIRLPIGENIRRLAKATGKPVEEIVVSVLHRDRHERLIEEIREAGAGTRLMSDGDVAGGINAARHNARTDICVGVGGSPEGIVTACAIKALGGHIQGRLWPRNDDEKQRGLDAGLKFDDFVYEADDLVKGNNTIFVATGVTDGQLVGGVRREGDHIYTESVVLRGASGTLRRISSEHLTSKWL
ncbi:MAG: fructose-bisphosphatase class II [Microbacterium sp.]|jgi:fructose-1,6-bisphosphatase II|uniref:Fructose-1,6-bisphosphatase n=3 Tax=Microbacterium TaxID=33882 RepID=A0A0F0LNY3_9MICO|nr:MULTISPECIES: class II fructose-bisphosphatase [Microbacterium]MAL05520.1 fructose-bisphosphatase class II [Microbacterium sp.]MCK9914984.1 class II fructose-bisphosphatase [Microbacteriaceae bacterium K1510]KJL34932.1 Fructose-1,6-bisphosphatase class 2 [Microbacterium ginsengisoli]KJL34983.1 Fructose-1,6-bisphosphatase class 2 [Microbacterium ginsengisoli]KQR90584.1 fructose 1,6-bisphosphatase [Microbacterium sp. Leaf351]